MLMFGCSGFCKMKYLKPGSVKSSLACVQYIYHKLSLLQSTKLIDDNLSNQNSHYKSINNHFQINNMPTINTNNLNPMNTSRLKSSQSSSQSSKPEDARSSRSSSSSMTFSMDNTNAIAYITNKKKLPEQKEQIHKYNKFIEVTYTFLCTLFIVSYFLRFVFSEDPKRMHGSQSIGMIVATYIVFCLILLLFMVRLGASYFWCKPMQYHQYIDSKILKQIVIDIESIIIVVVGLLFVVVDLVAPRTSLSSADTGVLFVELMTIVFSDAQVNESRRFTMFHAIVMTLVAVGLGAVAVFGLEDDAILFEMDLSADNNNNTNQSSISSSNNVSYSRNEVKRLLFLQLVTVLLPGVYKIYNNPHRIKLVFVEKQVERWEVMDPKTVQFAKTQHMKAELKRLTSQLRLVMKVEEETEMRPQRLSGIGGSCGTLGDSMYSTESPVNKRRGAVDIRDAIVIARISDLTDTRSASESKRPQRLSGISKS